MKVLLFKVGEEPEVVDIDGDIKSMQVIVGGFTNPVNLVTYSNDESLTLVSNTDAKNFDLPINLELLDGNGETLDFICGDIFVCRNFENMIVNIEDDDIEIALNYIKR